MKKEEVRARIEEIGILPSVRVASRDLALFAADTVYAAGIPIVEITLTIPGALEVIADLAKRYPDLVVGAGTVLDEESARRCVDAGARFLTSPGFVRKVVAYAKLTDVAVLPGALTPTEVVTAWQAGADLVKIFPANAVGGPKYIKALKGPFPQILTVPTGGVNLETAGEFLKAGASAVAVGGELVDAKLIRENRYDRIEELAREYLAVIAKARAEMIAAA